MTADPRDTGSDAAARPDVELRLPADSAYVSVLRTTTAGLAARLDFTLDDIEDLRMAVGEAAALVLPQADVDSDLTCGFHLSPGRMTLTVSVRASGTPVVDRDSFGWQVLTTLATEADVELVDQNFTARVTMVSELAGSGV